MNASRALHFSDLQNRASTFSPDDLNPAFFFSAQNALNGDNDPAAPGEYAAGLTNLATGDAAEGDATQGTQLYQALVVESGEVTYLQTDGSDDRWDITVTNPITDGTIIMATTEGCYAASIDLSAATYQISAKGVATSHGRGAAKDIIGAFISPDALTQQEIDQVVAWFVARGAVASFGGLTELISTWRSCVHNTSFPLIDTSSVYNFYETWRNYESVVSFPAIDVSQLRRLQDAFRECSSLENFPPNMFDSWNPAGTIYNAPFYRAWSGCNLTCTSVRNILVSIDTSGKWATSSGTSTGTPHANPEITIDYDTGTDTDPLLVEIYEAILSLEEKGWEVVLNGSRQFDAFFQFDASRSMLDSDGNAAESFDYVAMLDNLANGTNADPGWNTSYQTAALGNALTQTPVVDAASRFDDLTYWQFSTATYPGGVDYFAYLPADNSSGDRLRFVFKGAEGYGGSDEIHLYRQGDFVTPVYSIPYDSAAVVYEFDWDGADWVFNRSYPEQQNLNRAYQGTSLNQPRAIVDEGLYLPGVNGNDAHFDPVELPVGEPWFYEATFLIPWSGAFHPLGASSLYGAGFSADPSILNVFYGSITDGEGAFRNIPHGKTSGEIATVRVEWDGVSQLEVFVDGVSLGTKTLSAALTGEIVVCGFSRYSPPAGTAGGLIRSFNINGEAIVDFTAVPHGTTSFTPTVGPDVIISQSGNNPATIMRHPSARFDGDNDYLDGVFADTLTGGYMFAAFTVLGNGGVNGGRVLIVHKGGSALTDRDAAVFSRNISGNLQVWNNGGALDLSHTGGFSGSVLHEAKIADGEQLSLRNGTDLKTDNNNWPLASTDFRIGNNFALSTPVAIDLHYLNLHPADLSDLKAEAVRNHINNRYNLYS